MALDNIKDIREWRDRVADAALEEPKTVMGVSAGTMLQVLDVLIAEIDRLQGVLDTGKTSGDIKIIPLHKRRHIAQQAPDLLS